MGACGRGLPGRGRGSAKGPGGGVWAAALVGKPGAVPCAAHDRVRCPGPSVVHVRLSSGMPVLLRREPRTRWGSVSGGAAHSAFPPQSPGSRGERDPLPEEEKPHGTALADPLQVALLSISLSLRVTPQDAVPLEPLTPSPLLPLHAHRHTHKRTHMHTHRQMHTRTLASIPYILVL